MHRPGQRVSRSKSAIRERELAAAAAEEAAAMEKAKVKVEVKVEVKAELKEDKKDYAAGWEDGFVEGVMKAGDFAMKWYGGTEPLYGRAAE